MNLKNKLFAGLTALSVVAMSFAPAVNFVSVKADSAEDMAAYTWAFDEGLTTMTSFDAFMFENAINREQAARFLVKGAEALGIELSSDQSCDYKDLASADQSLVEFINEGCELGLFKAQADFNPKQLMTREQAELVVARMVYGMDEVNAYAEDAGITEFAAARELLMADEIVKVEIPAQASVKRGHLLLMLYRLADAEVTDPTVNPGHAEVSLVNAASTQEVPMNAVNVKVGTIKLTAGSNPTKVSSVEITRSGLANVSSVSDLKVALRSSSVASKTVSFNSTTNTASVRFVPALDLAAGSSQTFDVYVSLSGAQNDTHNFKVTDVNVSNGTASGAPVTLGTVKSTSAVSKNVDISISTNYSVKAGDNAKEIAKVSITPNLATGVVKEFVLSADGLLVDGLANKDLNEVFANAKAYYNDQLVGTVAIAKKKLIVSGLNIAKADGAKADIVIKADVIHVGEDGDYQFKLEAKSDLVVTEDASGFGMVATTLPTSNGLGEVKGYNIKLKKVDIEKDIAPDTSGAELFKATLTSASDVVLNEFKLEAIVGSAQLATLVNTNNLKLYVGGQAYNVSSTGLVQSDTDEGISISPNYPLTIRVVGNVKSADQIGVGGSVQFKFTAIKGENSDEDLITINESVNGDKVNLKSGTATVKTATVAAPSTKTIYSNATQEFARFSVKVENQDLKVNKITLAVNYTSGGSAAGLSGLLDDSDISLYVLSGDSEVSANVEYSSTGALVFSDIDYTIAKGKEVNFVVKGDFGNLNDVAGGKIKGNTVSVELKNSGTSSTYTGTVTFKEYTLGVQPPVVTFVKVNDNKFKVTIKNNDEESAITLSGVKARFQILAADADYTGQALLNIEGSSVTEGVGDASTGVVAIPGTAKYFVLSAPAVLSEDGGEISYEMYIDSSFINPAVLRASVTELSYTVQGTNVVETYDVSAQ